MLRILPPLILACSVLIQPAAALTWIIDDHRSSPRDFPLVEKGKAATLVISPDDFKVVEIATRDLAADIERITGARPDVTTSAPTNGSPVVLIGTLGYAPLIDALIASGRLDVGDLEGQWESFVIATVTDPVPGVAQGLVVVGSDRRGTAFGVYEISEAIGVSPWHWWADLPPMKRTELFVYAPFRRSGPPSVKYRGIFINDEDWGLQPWAKETFEPENGGMGSKTYEKVFELLLRLKANTLWPAMHECTAPFNADPRNAALADDYAIVMGSSHAEPMLRNNVREWTDPKPDYNYVTNRDGVRAYWEERVRTNGGYENIYTVGMRGIHDSAIQGTKTDEERILVLEQVFADQRAMLERNVLSEVGRVAPNAPNSLRPSVIEDIPQMFCAYKEVLDLYRKGLRVPDDVTIVWPDDNFGYIRNFASPEERKRSGGFGVYYHISYLGRPLAYLWLNTTPPALIMEEMLKAYEHGADQIWIVNVGDIKPAEIGTELFLRLAWDQSEWWDSRRFLYWWILRIFGWDESRAFDHTEAIYEILDDYYRLNFVRKPEHLQWWLPREEPRPSGWSDSEIDERLAEFSTLRARTDQIASELDPALQDAFFELVAYPVHGSALANERYFMGERGKASRALAADAELRELTRRFNEDIAGGKWRGFMNLEPADDDWKSMRIAPWSMPEFGGQDRATGSTQVIQRDAATYDRREDRADSRWGGVRGLGRSSRALSVHQFGSRTPQNRGSATATTRFEYDLWFAEAGTFTLRFELLPTHPIVAGRGLRLAWALDDGETQELVVDVEDGSAEWAQGVLNNFVSRSVQIDVPTTGSHCLKVFMVDAGVVLDRFVIERPTPAAP